MQASVVEWVAAYGEASERARAHRADGISATLGEMENRVEEAAVLVGNEVGVNAGRVDAGDGIVAASG